MKYLAKAVHHCHHNGIIVRNLNPDDIMFLDQKDLRSLVLTNFAHAMIIKQREKFSKEVKLDRIERLYKLEKAIIMNKNHHHVNPVANENSYLM